MKLRTMTAAMTLVLAVTGLSACTSKVGVAATIDGKNVSESTIASYLTPNAKPISSTDATGAKSSVPSRSFVMNTLIHERLFDKLVARLPKGTLTESAIRGEITRQLAGLTPVAFAEKNGVNGYSKSFDTLVVRTSVVSYILSSISQSGDAVTKAITGLKFPVTVSGRYGTWNPKTYALGSSQSDGYPSFLKFAPTAK